MVTPAQRRRAVEHLISRRFSQRRACRVGGFSRSAAWYESKGRDNQALLHGLKDLAERYPRYGCPTLHDMLKSAGQVRNYKRTYRLYRKQGLQLRTRKRNKITRARVPMLVPNAPNQPWSMDFVSDQLANGRRFRVFNVIDDYSRECVLQIVDTSISGERLARELNALSRPLPSTLVCDNGPEFTSKAMFFWARQRNIKLHFSEPGKPTRNVLVESFNGKFREYCLDLHWFASLDDAKQIIDQWRARYNHVRPHRSLGKMPPAVFAQHAA